MGVIPPKVHRIIDFIMVAVFAAFVPSHDVVLKVIGVGMVALDVTERRRAEEAQHQQMAMVETIQRVGRSVASELELETVVQEVTDAATSLTGAQFGAKIATKLKPELLRLLLLQSDTVFGVAHEMRGMVERVGTFDLLKGKILANLFYEPSTRTSSTRRKRASRNTGSTRAGTIPVSSTARRMTASPSSAATSSTKP